MFLISLSYNEEPEWLNVLIDNYEKYCKVPYKVVVNCSSNCWNDSILHIISRDNRWYVSDHFDRPRAGAYLLKAHCRNFEKAIEVCDFDYFVPIASNCLFVKDLNEDSLKNFDMYKYNDNTISKGIPIENYQGHHNQYYKPFFDMVNKYNYKYACGGFFEGLTLKKHIWERIFLRLKEIDHLNNLDPTPSHEEYFPHTIWYNEFYIDHNINLPYLDGSSIAFIYYENYAAIVSKKNIEDLRNKNNSNIFILKRFERNINDEIVKFVMH